MGSVHSVGRVALACSEQLRHYLSGSPEHSPVAAFFEHRRGVLVLPDGHGGHKSAGSGRGSGGAKRYSRALPVGWRILLSPSRLRFDVRRQRYWNGGMRRSVWDYCSAVSIEQSDWRPCRQRQLGSPGVHLDTTSTALYVTSAPVSPGRSELHAQQVTPVTDSLERADNSLTGTLLPIAQLVKLQSLDLAGNSLQGTLSTAFLAVVPQLMVLKLVRPEELFVSAAASSFSPCLYPAPSGSFKLQPFAVGVQPVHRLSAVPPSPDSARRHLAPQQ